MLYRQFIRVATLSALVFLLQPSVLHAQRMRKSTMYRFDNAAPGQISGKIDGGSSPLAGVHVSLWHEGKLVFDVTTGPAGTFDFKELTPGKYDLTCYKEGYRKREVYKVPVFEKSLTSMDLKVLEPTTYKEQREPKMSDFEELKVSKIEKMK